MAFCAQVSDLYHSGTLQYKLGRPSAPSSPRPAVPISAKDAHISDPSKAALSVAGSSRKTNNQQPETRRAKGRDQPAYSRESGVVDLTQNSSDHSGSRRDRHSSVEIVDEDELAASQGFSFSHSRGSDPNDEDEADSRYRASAKRPRLNGDDKFAPPKTYVVEDSDSDSGISTTFPTAQSGASNRTLAERRRPKKPSKSKKVASKDKSAYWSSKSTVSTPGNDSPEDGFIALAV